MTPVPAPSGETDEGAIDASSPDEGLPPGPPLRVLHLIDSLGVGGAERLLLRLAEATEGTRLDLTVAVLRRRCESPLADQIRAAGVPVAAFSLTDREHGGFRPTPAELIRLVRFVRRGAFDVVHTHLNTADALGPLVAFTAGVPVVSSQHSVGDGRTNDSLRERVRRILLRHGTAEIVAVGESVATARRRVLAPRRITVVPNPAPDNLAASDGARERVRAELGIGADPVVLLAAGRLEPPKDHGMLLDAVLLLREQAPEVVLVLAGDGSLRPAFEARVAELGLGSAVRLLGLRSDMADLFAAADVFVSSSRSEGMPLSILEAMSAGLPVVATDVGDCRAVLGPAGTITPPGDPYALAGAVLSLSDPSVREELGSLARERALTRFGTSTWTARLSEVYERVAGLPTPGVPTP